MGYEYLISGLEDLQVGQPMKMSFVALRELLEEQMSAADYKYVTLLDMTADDPSIVAMMQDDEVLDRFHETSLTEEDFRTQLLYESGMKAKQKFVSKWFEFNLDFNNVMAAAICQKHGYDVEKAIVGENEVAQQLRRGNLQKNNMAVLIPELKEMVAVSEITNLAERERYQDALRWQWLDEYTLFKYFELDNVLAYYLKAKILHRWDELTKEKGEQVFRSLIADMKRDVRF